MDLGGLFYAKTDGSLIREIVQPMIMPNGVGLSPDEKTVYVAETRTGHLWGFDIVAPGVLQRGPPHENGGRHLAGPAGYTSFDSLAVERGGNICVASLVLGGINVIAPDGAFVELRAHARPDLHQHLLRRAGPDARPTSRSPAPAASSACPGRAKACG